MKHAIILLCLLFTITKSKAQIFIQTGATIHANGNGVITLQDVDLVNNGYFHTNGCKLLLNGSNSTLITGSAAGYSILDTLEIAKSTGYIMMGQDLNINSALLLTSGNIDLQGHHITLDENAQLVGESNNKYIYSFIPGAYITITKPLNMISNDNVGGLGAYISTYQNMGTTEVKRLFEPTITSDNVTSSVIPRQFVITPTFNNNLNATLTIHYLDNELSGLDENSLFLLKSEAPYTTFTNEGYSSIDASNNLITKSGINSFSHWAIADNNSPLPLQLLSFEIKCNGAKTILNWQTINENNIVNFEIESSIDGKNWLKENTVAFNENMHNYLYTSSLQQGFYRLKIVDNDNSFFYSNIQKAACNNPHETAVLYPNPAHDLIHISLLSIANGVVSIQIFDSKGALLKNENFNVLQGANTLNFDINSLSLGTYFLNAVWNNGKNQQQFKLIKE